MRQLGLAEQALRKTRPGRRPSQSGTHEDLARHVAAARDELSRFAQGLRPELLAAEGLRGVLPSSAVVDVGRLPEAIENATHFICAEALTNAAKHARAQQVAVRVFQAADTLHIEVSDDGVGGADPSGSGLRGLADRVAALGGTLQVISPPGRGTTVRARIRLNGEAP
jgi:signal transduction histidine kinase